MIPLIFTAGIRPKQPPTVGAIRKIRNPGKPGGISVPLRPIARAIGKLFKRKPGKVEQSRIGSGHPCCAVCVPANPVRPGKIVAITGAAYGCDSCSLAINAGSGWRYAPDMTRAPVKHPVPGVLGMTPIVVYQIPADWTGDAKLLAQVNGYDAAGKLTCTRTTQFSIGGATEPPAWPDGCSEGWAVVHVTGIPVMTDANKDQLNKGMLFAVCSASGEDAILIYNRYLQPGYPSGPWSQTWKIETRNGTTEREDNIWQTRPLTMPEAWFLVRWERKRVTVTDLWNDNTRQVTAAERMHIDRITTLPVHDHWGWQTAGVEATIEQRWCRASGLPEPEIMTIPDPPSTPPAEGHTSGRAVFQIANLDCGNSENGVLFCLDGPGGLGIWLRDNDASDHRAQIKGHYDGQWVETNWHASPVMTEGVYIIDWASDRVQVVLPRGETLAIENTPFPLAISAAKDEPSWNAIRPGEPHGATVELVSVEWGDE